MQIASVRGFSLGFALALGVMSVAPSARAVASAELYTSSSYRYGKFEARIAFPAGDGVVASFFLWKNGSEMTGVFWNELDFEKVGPVCDLQLNSIYGDPESGHESHAEVAEVCGAYHTYTYEWTPEYIAWFVDGVEVRRDMGADAQAYVDNATNGMQFRFNIWPGTAAFGGNFSPDSLPLHQYISWVQYSAHTPGAAEGEFTLTWRESFESGIPSGYLRGSWPSPLNQSTHASGNVTAVDGVAVLSLTEDGAPPFAGVPPVDPGELPSLAPTPSTPPAPPAPAPGVVNAGGAGPGEADDGTASAEGGCAHHAPARGAGGPALWLLSAAIVFFRKRQGTAA